MTMNSSARRDESGNVLFLILIAVALFAALSYAVTQSTRSGSGSTERETNLLGSATMTQYPTALRTAVVRMVLNGRDLENIGFNPPSNFSALGTDLAAGVFHPQGGGAVYQLSSPDAMVSGQAASWRYNGNFEVPDIGQTGAGGNDLIAFLPGVSLGVCQRVNEELGVPTSGGGGTFSSGVPQFDATTNADITDDHLLADTFPTGDRQDIDNGGTLGLDGQAAACFFEPNLATGGQYVFYAIILER